MGGLDKTWLVPVTEDEYGSVDADVIASDGSDEEYIVIQKMKSSRQLKVFSTTMNKG